MRRITLTVERWHLQWLAAAGLAIAIVAGVALFSVLSLHGASAALKYIPPEAQDFLAANGDVI